jgi:hypothetical protein
MWRGACAVIAFAILSARADPPPQGAPSEHAPVDTVIIETRRRQELEQEVNRYVGSVAVHPRGEALARWDQPVCPLVAGLPRTEGEFMLARLSQIARQAGAPLGSETCTANLFVVLADDPEDLLKRWWARNRRLFMTRNGLGGINAFIGSPRPVRVWYNSDFLSAEGLPAMPGTMVGMLGTSADTSTLPMNQVHSASRLRHAAVPGLSSVIVVVDNKRLAGLNFGQLADYVAMLSLAQVRLDADTGTTPTILSLFRGAENRPTALSPWDEAFLASLYHTQQASVTQLSSMEHTMLDSVAR